MAKYAMYLDCYRNTYDAKVVEEGEPAPEWASEYTSVYEIDARNKREAVLKGMEIADERWNATRRSL